MPRDIDPEDIKRSAKVTPDICDCNTYPLGIHHSKCPFGERPIECRRCGLLKSTIIATGRPCIDRKGVPHDFCEKVGDKEVCVLGETKKK